MKEEFDDYKEILSLAAFMLEESSASYLFTYWHDEYFIKNIKNSIRKTYPSFMNMLEEMKKQGSIS